MVGAITDATGAAVAGAGVEAMNVATGVKTQAVANESGLYRIGNLLPGTYNITVNATGFTSTSLRGVAVESSKVSTANLTLQVGQVTTSVEVNSAPAVIDTTTASIQSTFSTTAARDLPIASIGIGSANLSLLNAGVGSSQNLGVGEGPSVGGQRPYNNNFMVEGVDDNNKSVTGSLLRTIPNDAVSEFTVLQNQMSAEYGHSSGGQFNTILKGGTNEIHVTLYEYFQNRNLNAIDQQVQNSAIANGDRPSNPRFDSNRFGGSIGGPIIKNKLFYFGLLEYNPVGASSTPANLTAPTAAGLAKLAAIPNISQTNLNIFKQYVPVPAVATDTLTVAGVSIPVGSPQINSPNYQNNKAAVGSVDYTMSDRDQFRGRIVYNKLSQIDTTASLPQFFQLEPGISYLASLNEYHNFSANVTNELRLGYNRYNLNLPAGDFKYPGLDAFPSITIEDLSLEIGPNPQAPQSSVQNTYQLADTATWIKGKHTLKFGFDGRKFIAPSSFTQRSRGEYKYTDFETFLLDITPDEEAQRGLGNVVFYGDQLSLYGFANDSWRLRPNFTVNLGVRYEYNGVPYSEKLQRLNAISNVPGLLTFGEPQAQKKNFAPRIGIAYSPGTKGTTSLRAGFGTAYDVLYDNIGTLQVPPQLKTTADVTGNGAPNFLKNGGISQSFKVGALDAATARANTSAYIGPQIVPYSIQWNAGVQHVFKQDFTFEARYLGTRGVHLNVQRRINKQTAVTATQSLPIFLSAPSQASLDALPLTLKNLQSISNIVPRFAAAGFTNPAFVEDSPIGNSTYHGLALQLNRRFARGLFFQGAYTWSHLIDDSTADFNTTALTPRRPQDFQNLRADRGTSALDRRQRLTFAAVYDTPWFKHSNWMAKNLVGNWSIAPIYTFESPELITVQSIVDSNLNGDSAPDRTIINPAGKDGTGSGVTPLCRGTGACSAAATDRIVGYLAKDPNARYIVAGLGAYANAGRNTLSGRRINNWDLNLLKNFNVTERYRVQFSAQIFNVLNHAQFIPGQTNRVDVISNLLNNGPAIRSYVNPANSAFNNPEAIYSSNPRGMQLALKLFF